MVLKELILTVSTLRGCGGVENPGFNSVYFWEGVMFLKELILTISNLQGCGSLERTDFNRFLLLGMVVAVLKELISTLSTLGRCGSPEKTELNSFYFARVGGSMERTGFNMFLL